MDPLDMDLLAAPYITPVYLHFTQNMKNRLVLLCALSVLTAAPLM